MRQFLLMCVSLVALSHLPFSVSEASDRKESILVGSDLSPGFDMGVNSSGSLTDWLTKEGDCMKMSYPANQSWGAVFITVSKPKQPPRPARDFSSFDTLSVEMRSDSVSTKLGIALKTNEQRDNGTETKLPVNITSDWEIYKFSLNQFRGVDLKKLYVIIQFVFSGTQAQTVYFRNVVYLNSKVSGQDESSVSTKVASVSEQSLINVLTSPLEKVVNYFHAFRREIVYGIKN